MTKSSYTALFILNYGIVSGLMMSLGFVLVKFIGPLAVFTSILMVFLTMYFFIKCYTYFFKTDLTILMALFCGIPVYLIGLLVYEFFYHFGSSVSYSEHGRMELVKEVVLQSSALSIFLSFVFLPIHRGLTRKKV